MAAKTELKVCELPSPSIEHDFLSKAEINEIPSFELMSNDANVVWANLSKLLESMCPTMFNDLLVFLISSTGGKFLLTRDQTTRILNISDEWLTKLTESGKLRTEDGCFRVDAVYDFKQKQHILAGKALKKMAKIENSVSTEIY